MAKAPAELTGPQVLVEGSDGFLGETTSTSWYKKVREMRRDPTIALARWLVTAPVLAAKWSYEETDGAPEGAAEHIKNTFEPARLHLLRNAFFGWIDFGWQPFEKVFVVDEITGLLKIAKFKPLIQDSTKVLIDEKTGAYIGLKQGDDGQPLKTEQTLLLSCDVEGTDWYGQAIAKNAEAAYDAWKVADKAAAKYDQRIAGSHWVVYYPLGTSMYNGKETDNFEIAKEILAALSASGRVAVPRTVDQLMEDVLNVAGNVKDGGWRIEIMSDTGTSQSAFIERFKYLDTLKVRAFGLPERSVLEGRYGTKAEAGAHADFAITNMELRHEMACQDINWHAVNQVLTQNWGNEAANTVYIQPSPIADKSIGFLRNMYIEILKSPDGFATELLSIDMEAVKETLGVPLAEDLLGDPDADLAPSEDTA